jgi:hypothetical protein
MSFSTNRRKLACVVGFGLLTINSFAPMMSHAAVTPLETSSGSVSSAIAEVNRIFISQYPSRFNPFAFRRNNNCGPACLAMALRIFGHGGSGRNAQDEILAARSDMTGNVADRLTGLRDVVRGARANGLNAYVARTMQQIDDGLGNGAVAVVSGSPSMDTSYGTRLPYTHAKAGHFILITKKVGDQYIMCDPESLSGAYSIDRKELIGFMYYYQRDNTQHGAVMIEPPPA